MPAVLPDDATGKNGHDEKRCVMEARLEGLKPLAVTHHAGSVHEAIEGAGKKLEQMLGHAIGQRDGH